MTGSSFPRKKSKGTVSWVFKFPMRHGFFLVTLSAKLTNSIINFHNKIKCINNSSESCEYTCILINLVRLKTTSTKQQKKGNTAIDHSFFYITLELTNRLASKLYHNSPYSIKYKNGWKKI